MKCTNCGSEDTKLVGNSWVCFNCKNIFQSDKAYDDLPRGKSLASIIPKLPFTLSLMLDEYIHEADDYVALHRMCGAIEITVRFLAIVVLADVRRRSMDFPPKLINILIDHFRNPTLGQWRVILDSAVDALPGKKGQKKCLISELPDYVNKLIEQIGSTDSDPMHNFLPMRNILAHNGRLTDSTVNEFIEAHAKRFEELMKELEFLCETKLVMSTSDGEAIILQGFPIADKEVDSSKILENIQQFGTDRMLLITNKGILDLCPLQAYGNVVRAEKDKIIELNEKGVHIYSRTLDTAIEYTVLGDKSFSSRGMQSWEDRFFEMFQFELWRKKFRNSDKYSFNQRMEDLLGLFIGRDKQIQSALELIDATDNAIIWLSGKPGMGKSAFMAKLAQNYLQRDNLICIPYFFQSSDVDYCRISEFQEAVLLKIASATRKKIRIEDDSQKRSQKFKAILNEVSEEKRRLVLFVDGIDEIASLDMKFIDTVFDCQFPGITWVCAGRDEDFLRQRFSIDKCQCFFSQESKYEALKVKSENDEGLLPPLDADSIRGYFIERFGHRLPKFFSLDKKDEGRWQNEFVEKVVQRSEGLPLYLYLLVQDIKDDRVDFSPESWSRLPIGLEEYFNKLTNNMGNDLTSTIPAITSLLALAKEPLSLDIMIELLANHHLVRLEGGIKYLKNALQSGSIMFHRSQTASGSLGYKLYHTSFRDHIQSNQGMEGNIKSAIINLCDMAVNWSKYKGASLSYAIRFGPSHLAESKCFNKLKSLLLDFRWIQAKLNATNANDLLSDYSLVLDDDDINTVKLAINLSAHVFFADKDQLASQLIGRLPQCESPRIKEMLKQAVECQTKLWIKPLTASLIKPNEQFVDTNKSHSGWVNSVAMFPDGKRIISASNDRTLKMWDIENKKLIHTFVGHDLGLNCVSLTPNGKYAISASSDRTLKVWDIDNRTEIRTLTGHTDSVECVTITSDGKLAVSGSEDHTLKVWDIESGKFIYTLKGHKDSVKSVAITRDSKYAISASEDKTLKVWDINNGKELRSFKEHKCYVYSVATTPDGKYVISGANNGLIKMWDIETAEEIKTLKGHDDLVSYIAITSDGKKIFSGSVDETMKLWDIESGEEIHTFTGHNMGVWSICLTPDENMAVTSSDDSCIKMWDVENRREIYTFKGLPVCIGSIAISPDERFAIIGLDDGKIKVFDIKNKNELRSFVGHIDGVSAVAWTPDGKYLISGGAGEDCSLKVWSPNTEELIYTLSDHSSDVTSLALLPDNEHAISASSDKTLKIWDIKNGKLIDTLIGHTSDVFCVAVTPDGKFALSGSQDNTIRLWSLETRELIYTFKEDDWTGGIVITPDGKYAVSISYDYTIKIWDIENRKMIRKLEGHTGWGGSIALTKDGKRIISTSYDRTVRIWDFETGNIIACFYGDGAIWSCAVASDGTILAGDELGRLYFLRLEGYE